MGNLPALLGAYKRLTHTHLLIKQLLVPSNAYSITLALTTLSVKLELNHLELLNLNRLGRSS